MLPARHAGAIIVRTANIAPRWRDYRQNREYREQQCHSDDDDRFERASVVQQIAHEPPADDGSAQSERGAKADDQGSLAEDHCKELTRSRPDGRTDAEFAPALGHRP